MHIPVKRHKPPLKSVSTPAATYGRCERHTPPHNGSIAKRVGILSQRAHILIHSLTARCTGRAAGALLIATKNASLITCLLAIAPSYSYHISAIHSLSISIPWILHVAFVASR
ncbi:hypothetical protein BDZ91DRAFT_199521 [Kalaharituber pfeilii]|nr:hypothetical protein BDZ91DRAFT_199521 [Kalaharituber pfeilii]